MIDVDHDLMRQRRKHLTPSGQELLDDILQEMESGAASETRMEEFVSRIGMLPAGDREEVMGIFMSLAHSFGVAQEEAEVGQALAQDAIGTIRAAQEKQRAAGEPANENMTLGEAIEILLEE
jgi:hypothetical protein